MSLVSSLASKDFFFSFAEQPSSQTKDIKHVEEEEQKLPVVIEKVPLFSLLDSINVKKEKIKKSFLAGGEREMTSKWEVYKKEIFSVSKKKHKSALKSRKKQLKKE